MVVVLPLLLALPVSYAASVYLHPPTTLNDDTSSVSPPMASLLLSAHFGFDRADTFGDDDSDRRGYIGMIEKAFVGVGDRRGLFVGIDEEFAAGK